MLDHLRRLNSGPPALSRWARGPTRVSRSRRRAPVRSPRDHGTVRAQAARPHIHDSCQLHPQHAARDRLVDPAQRRQRQLGAQLAVPDARQPARLGLLQVRRSAAVHRRQRAGVSDLERSTGQAAAGRGEGLRLGGATPRRAQAGSPSCPTASSTSARRRPEAPGSPAPASGARGGARAASSAAPAP